MFLQIKMHSLINKYWDVYLKTTIKKKSIFIIIAYSKFVREIHIIFTNKNAPTHWGRA